MTADAEEAPGDGAADQRARVEPNVGVLERAASIAAGGALVVHGLRRRSPVGLAAAAAGGVLVYRGVSGESFLYRAFGTDSDSNQEPGVVEGGTRVSRTVTVDAPAEDLHDRWQDPDTLERVVAHFADVSAVDEGRFHWSIDGPAGRQFSWESQVVEDDPGERLRWASLPGAPVPNEWTVEFDEAPGDRGTKVTLTVDVDAPGGRLGTAAVDHLSVLSEGAVGEILRRFKRLVETGEIPSLEANPSARGKGDLV